MGQRIDVSLPGHAGFAQTIHVAPDLRLARYDEPCSLDIGGECKRASYDATLEGYPLGYGLFLPLVLDSMPDGYVILQDSSVFEVTSPSASMEHGTLSSGTYHFGDQPIPEAFELQYGEETLRGTLESVEGKMPSRATDFLRTKPPATPLAPSHFPGSDRDFLGIGAPPADIFSALLRQQPAADSEWQNGGCLRRFAIDLEPASELGPGLAGNQKSYGAKATIEQSDGTATEWDFEVAILPTGPILIESAATTRGTGSQCHEARALAVQHEADAFWEDHATIDARGTPIRFSAIADRPSQDDGTGLGAATLHYELVYRPGGAGLGFFPNRIQTSAADGSLIFLETSISENAPSLA